MDRSYCILRAMCYTVILFLLPFLISAQNEDLTKSKRFFKKRLCDYETWMTEINLSEMLATENLEILPDRVTLNLKGVGRYRNPEIISEAWTRLRQQVDDSIGGSLERLLLQKFIQVMELAPESAGINILTPVPGQFSISMAYKDGGFSVEENLGEVRGDPYIKVNLKNIKAFGDAASGSSSSSLEQTKDFLLEKLSGYYTEAESKFGNEPRVDILMNRNNEFTILISNISGQILESYFELIHLNVHLNQIAEEIEISYSVFGKYSSGIFKAPRVTSSDYKDMYPNYSAELTLYVDRLGQRIQGLLKK